MQPRASVTQRTIRLSWALPLSAFVVALLLVVSVIPKMLRVQKTVARQGPHILDRPFDPAMLQAMIDMDKAEQRARLPDPLAVAAFLNMPAILVEVVISLPTTWPDSWFPRFPFPFGELFFWRAVSWPFYALPLWWIAGRAIDALRSTRSGSGPYIHRVEAVLGGIIGTLCAVVGIGISLAPDPDGLHSEFRWLAIPGLLWFGLGLLSILARRRQNKTSLGL